MLTLPLISVVALYLLKKEIERGAMAGNGGRDTAVLVLNALFVALGIFANLGFEEIGLDLVVVLVLAVLAGGLLWRHGRQPLVVYYTVAYGGGLVITAVYRAVL